MLQFRNIVSTGKMSSTFKLQFGFGLFVLCVFHSHYAEAQHFKASKVKLSTASESHGHSVLSGLSRSSSSSSSIFNSASSMVDVNLRRTPSFLSGIHPAVSITALNTHDSPSIMQRTVISNSQAASALNRAGSQQMLRNPSMMQRLIPNLNKVKTVGDYLKTGAIITAGTGGLITIVDSLKGNDRHSIDGNKKYETGTVNLNASATERPEFHNPLGTQYK